MQVEVHIQDPTFVGTTYHLEAILAAARRASDWRGLYAFASRGGVNQLIGDQVVQDLVIAGKEIELVVGIDAVTNRTTLERMQEMHQGFANFRPQVFWNESRSLFHPKISDFGLEDGGRTLIVGSGNLTPGGLENNFEAYTVITVDKGDKIPLDAVREFRARHADRIRDIDEEVLERAARNIVRPLRGGRRGGPGGVGPPGPDLPDETALDRILLAQVPGAGGRWAQVHFNVQVIRNYFRLNNLDTQRVYLTHVSPDGNRREEGPRRCVYSEGSNRNHKIEIGAARDIAYPNDGRPILIFWERLLRTFDYMLLLPGENGYGPLIDLSNRLPSPGKGFPRPITDLATLEQAWPDCPILYLAREDRDL